MAGRLRVAVVGAGWAGLACAVELAEAGLPVTLFESARRAGGRARAVDWNGLEIDNGQHLLIGAYRETLRLIEKLGAKHRLRRLPLRLETPPGFGLAVPSFYNLLPPPLHVAAALLTARGLGWREKWAAARMMERLRSDGYRLPTDMSVAELLARHGQGESLVRLLWEPLCLAALNTPIAEASAGVFCHVLGDSLGGGRADSEFLLAEGSLDEVFVRPALDWLRAHGGDLRLGERAGRIAQDGTMFHLNGEAFDRVVCAVHPAQAAALLPETPALDGVRRQLAGLRWQPICTLWLRYPNPLAFPFPMLGLADGPGQWVFDRRELAPGLVSVVISAEGPHLEMDDEALIDRVGAQLRRIFPGLPTPLMAKRITEKRATFSCRPNPDLPANVTPLPGLYLAGDYTSTDGNEQNGRQYPATLESAVRSGVQCAHLITHA